MKKTLSILLSICMLFSFCVISFAEETNTIEEGKTSVIHITKDEDAVLTFTPEHDGAFMAEAKFISENSEYLTMASLSLSVEENLIDYMILSHSPIISDGWEDGLLNKEVCCFVARKGTEITVNASVINLGGELSSIMADEADISLTITDAKSYSFEQGQSYTCTYNVYDNLFFTAPDADAVYRITSQQTDLNVTICDEYGDVAFLCAHDDSEPADYVFRLEAGKMYLISIRYSDADYSDSTETFTVNVEDGSGVKPESFEISCDEILVNDYEFLYIDAKPYGSECNSNFSVSVANPQIIEIRQSDYADYILYGKKAGKTTVTVTDEATGVTNSIELRVYTPLQLALSFSSVPVFRIIGKLLCRLTDFFTFNR